MERSQSSQVVAGAVLILTGLLFLAPRLGWAPPWGFRDMWPLLIVAFGLVQTLIPGRATAHGVFWMMFGVLVFLDRQNVVRLGDSWPLLIVCAGALIFVGGWRRKDRRQNGQVPHGR